MLQKLLTCPYYEYDGLDHKQTSIHLFIFRINSFLVYQKR